MGYHPLIVFEKETQLALAAFNRPGQTYSATEIEGVIETKSIQNILFYLGGIQPFTIVLLWLETKGAKSFELKTIKSSFRLV